MARLTDRLRRFPGLGLRFGLVGVGSVLVYFTALLLLRPVIPGTAALAATSYLVSAIFNYALQSTFTFRTRAADARAILRYLAMHGICLAANSLTMKIAVDLYGIALIHAQLPVTVAVAALSFFLSCAWVYASPAAQRPVRPTDAR